MSKEEAALKALVKGRVQGVGFRYSTQLKARDFNLKGYVRNLPDGRVEVYAEGKRTQLEDLLAYLRRGPRMAHVEDIGVSWREPEKKHRGFNIAYY